MVTLALPDILRHLDTTVAQVAWVLISFNLVLGLVAVPAAVGFARVDPRFLGAVGIALFAGASAWCAVAQSIDVLIAARCVQALGGALALVGCLELLVAVYGERRGIAAWITAGVIGTATGPVAGGLLTQAISWQAIFVVQVPVAVLAVPAALAVRAGPARCTRPARSGPASPGGASQPDPRPAVGRADGGAVPAGPAPGGRLAALPGDRGAGGLRRTGRGARRPPPGPSPSALGRGRGRGGLLPDRRRAGRARDPAVGPPRLDRRAAGAGRPRSRPDRRPAHVPGDAPAPAPGRARELDHQCPTSGRGRRAGDLDARVRRGPPGGPGAGPGGDHRLSCSTRR